MKLEIIKEIVNSEYRNNFEEIIINYGYESYSDYLKLLNTFEYLELNISDNSRKKIVYRKSLMLNHEVLKRLVLEKVESYNTDQLAVEASSSYTLNDQKITKSQIIQNLENKEIINSASNYKKAIDFISLESTKINEKNLNKLVNILEIKEKEIYRNCNINEGIDSTLVTKYILNLIDFINNKEDIDELIKVVIIYYYFLYISPYHKDNGIIARILVIWYLLRSEYSFILNTSLSKLILDNIDEYKKALSLIKKNKELSNITDLSPLIEYFINNVYQKISFKNTKQITKKYKYYLDNGLVTIKEKELWNYVVTNYKNTDFTTKKLEKDYGKVAYATIRAFVTKFSELDLLEKTEFTNKFVYKIKE